MYATICKETGVIRHISHDLESCLVEKDLQEDLLGDAHVVVKIPQMMLDTMGQMLLDMQETILRDVQEVMSV